MQRIKFFILLGLGVVLALCGQAPLFAQTPTEIPYVWVGGEPNPLPQWCREQEVPQADSENDYFMGWSVIRPEKNRALQEAKAVADKKIARQTGIDVGLISNSRIPQTAEPNPPSFQVEVQEWEQCIQTYSQEQGATSQDNVYVAGVVLQFPKSEYARIRQWKEEQAFQNKEAITEFMKSAHELALEGQMIGALELLQQARSFAQKMANKPARAKKEKEALLESIRQEEQTIAGGLQLEFLTQSGLETYVSKVPKPIQARALFVYEGKPRPLSSGFPLALQVDQAPFPPQRSNEEGVVQFSLERQKAEGTVNLTIAAGASLAERISPHAYETLRAEQARFSFEVTLSPKIKTLIANAQQGESEAQANLGWRYLEGDEVGQNNQKALQWLRAAAGQGEPSAQNNLGWMYDEGAGVAQDDVSAFVWYSLAETNGSTQATGNKQIVANRMDAAALAQAKEQVQVCQKDYKGC